MTSARSIFDRTRRIFDRTHWIFDLDGTLTVAAHDFAAFKRANGMPTERTILEHLETIPAAQQVALRARLRAWEHQVASHATAGPGTAVLIAHLRTRGCRLAVLTRNTADNARFTLKAIGLTGVFSPILGRDEAPVKPDPAGVLQILRGWGARPEQAVMVGDTHFDIAAGRAAGVATVLLARGERPAWAREADQVVTRLDALV